MTDDREQRISEFKRCIAELRARLPRHSVPASMLVELDELEDELRRLQDEPTTPKP
jgi:hypothetical protein